MARGAFDTRVGFVMAAVGSAVGLGNLYRFPYLASTQGGAAFLMLYLILLFVIGLPALMAELSIGRRTRKSAIQAFEANGETKRWSAAGFIAIFGAVLLLSYYSVIAGWGLRFLAGSIGGSALDDPGGYFSGIAEGPNAVWTHLLFMALTIGIVVRGVSKGIEKASLIMMPVLFISVIALAIYGNVQAGAGAGREFYLVPDFDALLGRSDDPTAVPFTTVLSGAAGQTFFSIGLGIGTMLTYSSYLDRNNNLQTTGLTIGLADTGVAVLAGFMVFPLIYAFGIDGLLLDPGNSGSVGGLFIVIPTAFGAIGGTLGTVLAVAFFVMFGFAALSSAISLLEVPVSAVLDRFPTIGRTRIALMLGLSVYILGLPSALSLEFLGFADSLINNIVLLAGGLAVAVYAGWVRPEILQELRHGAEKGLDWSRFWIPVIRYPLPVLLLALLGLGIYNFGLYIAAL